MPTNKHATIRYLTLDKCFRNPGRRYYLQDLIGACNNAIYEFTGSDRGIRRRQIFDDIKFMKSPDGWNVPLEHYRDGHKVYYRYSDLSFSINNQPLNETEENQLKEALLTLSRFKGMPQFEWVDELVARLDSGLGLSPSKEKIIEFEQNDYLKGLEFITPIYSAILYKKTVSIRYQSFKLEDEQKIVLHPYFLKQYNNRWYVFGRNEANEYLLNLALDRIIAIDDSNVEYIPNKTLDFTEYFEDIVGVTVPNEAKLEKVEVKVSIKLFPYIQTKPIHGSQKIKERWPGFVVLTFDLMPNYEFESILLSHGEGVEVLAPENLREKIKNRIKTLNEKYIS